MKNQITIITHPIQNGLTGFGNVIVDHIAKLEGKRAFIYMAEYHKPRTDKQNRYYWGVVIAMYQQYFQREGAFLTREEVHNHIREYIWNDVIEVTLQNGYSFRKFLSSTRLNTVEFEQRMLLCRQYGAAQCGLDIPEPNEKIDKHVVEWLESPAGIYYDWDYRNYFVITDKNKEETKQ